MKKNLVSVLIALLCTSFPMIAHGSDDLCERASQRSTFVRAQFYMTIARAVGKQGEKPLAGIIHAMEKERVAALARCREAAAEAEDLTLRKGLECIAGARDAVAMTSCPVAAIMLTGERCALSVDSSLRILPEILVQQSKKQGWNSDAILEQIHPQLLEMRSGTIQDCESNVDTSPKSLRTSECHITAKNAADFLRCTGTRVKID